MGNGKQSPSGRGAVRILLFALLACTLSGAVILGALSIRELKDRRAGVSFYAQLAQMEHIPSPNPAIPAAEQGVHIPRETSPAASPEAIQAEPITVWEPPGEAVPTRPPSALDFPAIQQTCPDVVGWIQIEGTAIDYPIVQGEDNDYYLHHLADGTPNSAGSIMMHFTNDSTFTDAVTVLHGHHMNNGSMFGRLKDYKKEDYFLQHPVMRLYTPAGDYDVAIFAAYTVNGYAYGYPTAFADEAAFEDFIRRAVSSTGYETGVEPTYGDKLLLLSTCAYSFEGARYVVIGKIMP